MNDFINKLTLKRMFSEMRKASFNITDIKTCCDTYMKDRSFVYSAKINGTNVNFNNQNWDGPYITLKHGLVLKPRSFSHKWIKTTLGRRNEYVPINLNGGRSHISLKISDHKYNLQYRKGIESFLIVTLDKSTNLKFNLNDDLEFEFEDLPKNLYEWDEEHILYYTLKNS